MKPCTEHKWEVLKDYVREGNGPEFVEYHWQCELCGFITPPTPQSTNDLGRVAECQACKVMTNGYIPGFDHTCDKDNPLTKDYYKNLRNFAKELIAVEPYNWEVDLEDEFCFMFERIMVVPGSVEDGTFWINKMESFIRNLLKEEKEKSYWEGWRLGVEDCADKINKIIRGIFK